MTFTKATRTNSKLRLAITGTAGSGKTYGALLIAQSLGFAVRGCAGKFQVFARRLPVQGERP